MLRLSEHMFLSSDNVHPYGAFWLDVADKAIKALAVAVAGLWTFMNYKKSRTFHRKLEPMVSGEIFERCGSYYIVASTRLKNVGQSQYTITQEGTALVALKLTPEGRETLSVNPVFRDHAWIEPGEQIEDPIVLTIPAPSTFVAIRLNLRVGLKTSRADGMERQLHCSGTQAKGLWCKRRRDMRGQDQMPESLERTNQIELEKRPHAPGGERVQLPERADRTDDIEKGKKEKPGSL